MLTRSQSKRMDDQRCSLKVMDIATDITVASNSKAISRKPLLQQNSNQILSSANSTQIAKENR